MNTVKTVICSLILVYSITESQGERCGCREMRACYKKMLDALIDGDETPCIEDASLGSPTVVVSNNVMRSEKKPVIIIEAGQDGRYAPVRFALYLIEQLVACTDYDDMISTFQWVILPCTNPDGFDYEVLEKRSHVWKKNQRVLEDKVSVGVDITRNFQTHWDSCEKNSYGFSADYPGPEPASENETLFVQHLLGKYVQNNDLRAYVSMRAGGHGIFYPYAYSKQSINNLNVTELAAQVAKKVNTKAGSVYLFRNESIYEFNEKPRCGHSVDYAADLAVRFAYEFKMIDKTDGEGMLETFFTMPKGYDLTLRTAYFNGIKEMFNYLKKDYTNTHE